MSLRGESIKLNKNDPLFHLKVNDASGSYAGGLAAGNQHRLVDRSICDSLNGETQEYYSDLQRGVENISKIVPYAVHTVVAKYEATILGHQQEVWIYDYNFSSNNYDHFFLQILYSICFTQSCSETELWNILEYNPNLAFGSSAVKNVSLVAVRILLPSFNVDLTAPNILYLL